MRGLGARLLVVVGLGLALGTSFQGAAGASPAVHSAAAVRDLPVTLTSGWNAVAFQDPRLTSLSTSPSIRGLAWWNGQAYTTSNFNLAEVNAAGGGRQAFWVLSEGASSFTYSGEADGQGNFVDLRSNGFQMVSFCTEVDIAGSSLRASQNGQTVPLASVVVPQFTEIGPANQYRPVDLTTGTLKPGRVYWVSANTSQGSVRLTWVMPSPSPSPTPALPIRSLSLSPLNSELQVGGTRQFALTATLEGGSTRDVAALAEWSSQDPSTAASLGEGAFKGLNPFATQVTARLQGQSVATNLTVLIIPTVGPVVTPPVPSFVQNFDGVTAPALPPGWTVTSSASTGAPPAGNSWTTSTTTPDTVPNCAFGPDLSNPGSGYTSELVTPSFAVPAAGGGISFRLSYDMEFDGFGNYDGTVLEVSIAGGAWTDLVAAGGSFTTGGYNGTMTSTDSPPQANPLLGRNGWVQNSGGYLTQTVSLPAGANGQSIQLRWRVGCDSVGGAGGARLDTITSSW